MSRLAGCYWVSLDLVSVETGWLLLGLPVLSEGGVLQMGADKYWRSGMVQFAPNMVLIHSVQTTLIGSYSESIIAQLDVDFAFSDTTVTPARDDRCCVSHSQPSATRCCMAQRGATWRCIVMRGAAWLCADTVLVCATWLNATLGWFSAALCCMVQCCSVLHGSVGLGAA